MSLAYLYILFWQHCFHQEVESSLVKVHVLLNI